MELRACGRLLIGRIPAPPELVLRSARSRVRVESFQREKIGKRSGKSSTPPNSDLPCTDIKVVLASVLNEVAKRLAATDALGQPVDLDVSTWFLTQITVVSASASQTASFRNGSHLLPVLAKHVRKLLPPVNVPMLQGVVAMIFGATTQIRSGSNRLNGKLLVIDEDPKQSVSASAVDTVDPLSTSAKGCIFCGKFWSSLSEMPRWCEGL